MLEEIGPGCLVILAAVGQDIIHRNFVAAPQILWLVLVADQNSRLILLELVNCLSTSSSVRLTKARPSNILEFDKASSVHALGLASEESSDDESRDCVAAWSRF